MFSFFSLSLLFCHLPFKLAAFSLFLKSRDFSFNSIAVHLTCSVFCHTLKPAVLLPAALCEKIIWMSSGCWTFTAAVTWICWEGKRLQQLPAEQLWAPPVFGGNTDTGKIEIKLLYFLLPPVMSLPLTPNALSPHISLSHHPQHWAALLLICSSPLSLSPCSTSLLLWGLHRIGILQRHCVPDGLWRPLSEMDRVSGLCDAVPGSGTRRSQLLQEPGPRVQPLVLLPAELRGHWLGLLWLSPG